MVPQFAPSCLGEQPRPRGGGGGPNPGDPRTGSQGPNLTGQGATLKAEACRGRDKARPEGPTNATDKGPGTAMAGRRMQLTVKGTSMDVPKDRPEVPKIDKGRARHHPNGTPESTRRDPKDPWVGGTSRRPYPAAPRRKRPHGPFEMHRRGQQEKLTKTRATF